MGAELLESEGDLLTDYLRQAEAASGQPIRKIMLEGPMDALTRTEVAQPPCSASRSPSRTRPGRATFSPTS